MKLAVTITPIVLLFKESRLFPQRGFIGHLNAAKKLLLIMVIEFFHYAITPRLAFGNEPELNAIEQAQPNQAAHAMRMCRAAVENHLVVDLLMLRHSQPPPDGPKRINGMLCIAFDERFNSATPSRQINGVEAVKTRGAVQITRADEIRLMNRIDRCCFQRGILLAFGFITTGSPMRQLMPAENTIDRPQRRQRAYALFFHFPTNRLRAAKKSVVIKIEAHRFNDLLNLERRMRWVGLRAP